MTGERRWTPGNFNHTRKLEVSAGIIGYYLNGDFRIGYPSASISRD